MERETNCGTCRYFKPLLTEDWDGICRRHPPVYQSQYFKDKDGYEDRHEWRGWPPVDKDDWCGEWA